MIIFSFYAKTTPTQSNLICNSTLELSQIEIYIKKNKVNFTTEAQQWRLFNKKFYKESSTFGFEWVRKWVSERVTEWGSEWVSGGVRNLVGMFVTQP